MGEHLQSNDGVFCFEQYIVSGDIFNAAPQVSLFIKTAPGPRKNFCLEKKV
jgi:hypothetical protein